MKPINVGIAGCLGRMGKELVKNSINDPRINFSGGFEHKKHELINKNLSEILNCETNKIVSSEAEEIFLQSDVIIDFTVPESSLSNIILAEKLKKPLIIGTTGLNEEASLQYQSLRHEAYLLIIDEPKLGFEQVYRDLEQYDDELSVLQNYRDARIQILSRTTKIINKFNSKPFKINGLDAEFLELEAKVNGVEDEIFYFLTFVDGGEKVYMIMAWTLKNRKEEHKKTFKTIAESFELID